jgi:ATP/maltotriose-dependent transcriptional regulator MalT
VKRHISNIYAKLGAKSRTQAVSLGRELRLFE